MTTGKQSGVFHHRVASVLFGETGYILLPALQRPSPFTNLLPSTYAIARLPYTEDKALIKQMPGFSSINLSHIDGSYLISGAIKNAGTIRGYFGGGAFIPFTVGGTPTVIGVFRHRYTEDAVEKTRILSIKSTGDIVDTQTGTTLSRTGTFFSSVDVLTWVASPNGKVLILEDTPTLSSDVGSTSQPTTRNIRRLDIDFLGSPQITVTTPASGSPYGTSVRTLGVSESLQTWNGSYPLVTGANDSGVVTITATEAGNNRFSHPVADPGSLIVYGTMINNPTVHLVSGNTYNYFWDYTHTVTVSLPGGVSKQFTLIDTDMEATASLSGTSGSISLTKTSTQRALGIIYADPTIPIVVYSLHTTVSSTSANSAFSTSPETFPSHSVPTTGTVTFSREVGVLAGSTQRVLFTETSSPVAVGPEPNRLAIKTGFVTGDTGGGGVDAFGGVPYVFTAPDPVTPGETSSDIVHNQVFFKQLKRVHTPSNAPTPYSGALDRGRLFVHNAGAVDHDPDLEPSYWVAAKDSSNWLVGVNRRKNLDGTTINDFQIYAGALAEPALRQRFINYLLEGLNSAEPPDTTAIADLTAGDLTPYRVSLGAGGLR